jgi:hypothetical protein
MDSVLRTGIVSDLDIAFHLGMICGTLKTTADPHYYSLSIVDGQTIGAVYERSECKPDRAQPSRNDRATGKSAPGPKMEAAS